MKFSDDNSFSSTGSYTQVLTITVSGQSNQQEVETGAFATDGTWERNGDTVTFMNDGQTEPSDAQIVELTETEMTISVSLDQNITQQSLISETIWR